MSMNFDQARFNMVEQQVRPWEVLDARVLELLETTHREDFVPVRYRKMAFADIAIPLDHDRIYLILDTINVFVYQQSMVFILRVLRCKDQ